MNLKTLRSEFKRYAVLARRAEFMENQPDKAERYAFKALATLALIQMEVAEMSNHYRR